MVHFTTCRSSLFLPKAGPINPFKLNYIALKGKIGAMEIKESSKGMVQCKHWGLNKLTKDLLRFYKRYFGCLEESMETRWLLENKNGV